MTQSPLFPLLLLASALILILSAVLTLVRLYVVSTSYGVSLMFPTPLYTPSIAPKE
jgi:hypothetical protein